MTSLPAYFDTSVLLKRYIQEGGSVQARTLFRRFRCLVSAIAPLEAVAALYRRLATGELRQGDLARLQALIQRDRAHWELLEVHRQILERAEDVIREASVRTLDAIHLATAILAQTYAGHRIPFITGDATQRDAGEQLGFDVVWVA